MISYSCSPTKPDSWSKLAAPTGRMSDVTVCAVSVPVSGPTTNFADVCTPGTITIGGERLAAEEVQPGVEPLARRVREVERRVEDAHRQASPRSGRGAVVGEVEVDVVEVEPHRRRSTSASRSAEPGRSGNGTSGSPMPGMRSGDGASAART